ncbi:MAG: hypothetical protein V3U76_13565 [Granulosicoccus sp.]
MKTNMTVGLLVLLASCSSSNNDTSPGRPLADDPGADSIPPALSTNGSIIGVDNYQSVLTELISLLNSRPFDAVKATFEALEPYPEFTNSSDPTLILIDSVEDSDRNKTIRTLSCKSGGTYTQTFGPDSVHIESNLEQCGIDGTVLDAQIERIQIPRDTEIVFDFKNYTVSYSGDSVHALKGVRSAIKRDRHGGEVFQKLEWNIDLYEHTGNGGTTSVTSLQSTMLLELVDSPALTKRSIEAAFELSAPWTLEQSVTITTPEAFSNFGASGTYESGILKAIAADGSSLELNADNGDPLSVTVTVVEAGTTSSFTNTWAATGSLRCFAPASEAPELYGCDL